MHEAVGAGEQGCELLTPVHEPREAEAAARLRRGAGLEPRALGPVAQDDESQVSPAGRAPDGVDDERELLLDREPADGDEQRRALGRAGETTEPRAGLVRSRLGREGVVVDAEGSPDDARHPVRLELVGLRA